MKLFDLGPDTSLIRRDFFAKIAHKILFLYEINLRLSLSKSALGFGLYAQKLYKQGETSLLLSV